MKPKNGTMLNHKYYNSRQQRIDLQQYCIINFIILINLITRKKEYLVMKIRSYMTKSLLH